MLFQTATLALFFSAASAHMVITSPVPFGKNLNNFPMNNVADTTFFGISDYPCKQRGVDTYTMASGQTYAPMALGSSQSLAFMGSAVHGGGSCQISISYDLAPTNQSTFKVIHSIEGGCPARNQTGNLIDPATGQEGLATFVDPYTYNYTLPTNIPTGKATLAWTWHNKLGNREMYMNCAPIEITGTSSSKTKSDSSAYNALPDVFTANLGINNNACLLTEGKDLLYPNPGTSVERLGVASDLAGPIDPTKCEAVPAVAFGGSASNSSGPTSAAASSVVASSTTSAPGVFATSPAASSASPTAASSSPIASAATMSSSSSSPVASATSPASTGSGSAMKAGTKCTSEGMYNCISGTSFQQCASGVWSVVQAAAPGTSCTVGQSMTLDVAAVVVSRIKRGLVKS